MDKLGIAALMPGSWPPHALPNLNDQNCVETSQRTRTYNCIAWAAGDDQRWWWPGPMQGYWPADVPREETVEAFLQAFATLGYVDCADGALEQGVEKVAIYAEMVGGVPSPTHAARQLPDGRWTSKIGPFEDVEHTTVNDVNCPTYGVPVRYLRRPRQQQPH
jgi:hypothetical protein